MIPINVDFPLETPIIRDPDVLKAYEWLMNFMPKNEWQRRKKDIEDSITITFTPKPPVIDIRSGRLISIDKDRIGWYLYLVYVYQNEPYRYDFHQGARVMPIFKRLGMDLELVKGIKGIERKIKELIRKRPSEADAILFEILTALLWVKNGWNVEFIPENGSSTSPDFKASKGSKTFQIECKRQRKTGDYAYEETAKRQILISHIAELLAKHNVLLDVIFHVELKYLPDTYLLDLLKDIIPNVKTAGTILSTETLEIKLFFIDIKAIQNHLARFDVKNNSPQMIELIANKPVDNSAFTCGIMGDYMYLGSGQINNVYVRNIYNAYGVQTYCDAKESINAKARDIKSQIHSAIQQFQSGSDGVIHIGIETHDGPEIEMARAEKIINTFSWINPDSNNLRWIYLHFFQSYSRSYEDWFLDETVRSASSYVNPIPPLQQMFLIIPEDTVDIDERSHWDRPVP